MALATVDTEPLSSISLPKMAPKKKNRKELSQEARCASHENLRPIGEQWLTAKRGGNERGDGGKQQHGPAAKGEPDQKTQPNQDA